ncbi:MAG: branched-chain amino acid ABC transporter permease, partial [Alphaproteobacteria bacterium]
MDPVVVFLQAVVSGVSIGCIYALVALGFVLIYKATEVVNFAQGELMMVGAFFAYTLVDLGSIPFVPGVLLALLATAAFGVFINRLLLRPLIGSPAFTIVLATVAVSTLIRAVVAMVPGWGVETHRLSNPVAGKVISVGDLVISAEHLLVIVITILLVVLLYVFFSRSRLGIALQATSQNQLAAGYAGINVRRMFGLIWGI